MQDHVAAKSKSTCTHHAIGTCARAYPLGYSQGEFRRLEQQSELIADLTADLLRRAGIREGMRILDVGCGVGDVSLLAGRLVGSAGSVLGIDRSADAVKTAKRRAIAAGLHHVTFAACELDAFGTEHLFDAVVGRLVLMYTPRPAATLRLLSCHLRPGGIMAFQEMAMPGCRSILEGPLFRRCLEWITRTFERGGFETDMGGKLFSTFLAAKLPAPKMVSVSHIDGGAKSPVYEYITETVRSLLPMMERLGVATDADVLVETLAHRLREEAIALRTCVMLPPLVGAWVRTQV